MRDAAFACPACREPLDELSCVACGRIYEQRDGVPDLVAASSHAVDAQAAWFDTAVDAEWEIQRPQGAPRFHRWLLTEKFRRGVNGVDLRGATVLAVCAGSGMDAEFLARAGADVVAADISMGAAKRAQERARRTGLRIAPVVADAAQLPFADRAFDVVYVHDGLHHLADPLSGVAEMARVAERVLCITEPAAAAATAAAVRLGVAENEEEAGNKVVRFTVPELAAALDAAGFRVRDASRYAMFYRHDPGIPMRLLSLPIVFPIAVAMHRLVNVLLGDRIGNKLSIVAVRA